MVERLSEVRVLLRGLIKKRFVMDENVVTIIFVITIAIGLAVSELYKKWQKREL